MYWSVFISLLLAACRENYPLTNISSEPCSSEVRSRGAVINPDLINNWENLEKITLASGKEVSLPWENLSSTKFDTEYAKDIKKEDGWMMLFHTMNEQNLDIKANYMFFYNRLTGFLKVFYYEENEATQARDALWDFCSLSGNTALFNLNDYIALPDNERPYKAVEISNMTSSKVTGFTGGWNGFELEFPYTQDYKNIYFGTSGYGKRLMSFTFSGTTESTIEGMLTKISEKESGLLKSIAALGGQGAKSYINKLKENEKENPKASFGKKVLDALANISAGDFASAMLKGLKFVFGSSTVADNQYVKLTSKGTIEMEGNGSETIHGTPFPIGNIPLYEIMNTPHTIKFQPEFNYLTLYKNTNAKEEEEQFLGIWTLTEAPQFCYRRYSQVYLEEKDLGCIQKAGLDYPYEGFAPIQNKVIINPNISSYITQLSVSFQPVLIPSLDGKYIYNPFLKNYNGDLLYSDKSISVYEIPQGRYDRCPELQGKSIPDDSDYQLFYDWGETPPNTIYAVVTVNIHYNYNGKEKNIVSSRLYKANCIIDPESEDYIHVGKAYIVNTGKFYDENTRY